MFKPTNRCINIDWLEVHCIEPLEPRDADYFRALGFEVSMRDYGTRVYEEMFTLYLTDGQPFLEVRRKPHMTNDHNKFQVLELGSCHLRLHNRACYFNDAGSILQQFITTHGYQFRRISRIDLCLDFERFDSGDYPAKFVKRYLNGRFAKVNQCSIAVHGQDMWDGQQWNSLAWGSKKSPIFTRFYNKSLELREVKDKPYIRQAWASAGLVDDFIQLTKKGPDGSFYKPEIWRLEFAIQSSVKNWVCFDVDENGNKTHRSVRNDLSRYLTRDHLESMYSSLVNHYFHFKEVEPGHAKGKYDCPDKRLFDFSGHDSVYKVDKVTTAKVDNRALLALKRRIEEYKLTHIEQTMRRACDLILESIEKELIMRHCVNPHDETEVQLLQRLIAYRMNGQSDKPLTVEKQFIESLLELPDAIF